jgi:crotonobetainyl-CoA:carnitine CoA-transferase CaiB-like acyl-CoA transferase
VFTVQGDEQIFLAAVSDTQWAVFCAEFGFDDLKADARLGSNNLRVQARDWMIPMLRERLAPFTAHELSRRFEATGLPFAPITRPQDLFDDPHLLATGGLAEMDIPPDASGAGTTVHTRTALLPLAIDGQRLQVRQGPPTLGEHGAALLAELGYNREQIEALVAEGVVHAVC